jgi:cytochrome c peroxidase
LGCILFAGMSAADALTPLEKLGGLIYRDENLSANYNQSCMTCHHPAAGFADPANRRDPVSFPVSAGSDPNLFGGRNAPSAAYAGFSPILGNASGVWQGGMFWDGRATGKTLRDPLAEQAQGPFQNPVEMGLTPATVVQRVAASAYANLFLQVYPDTDFTNVDVTYAKIARAIAAFERSSAVTKFTSKFDKFWAECRKRGINVGTITQMTPDLPQGILTTRQLQGLVLFNDKANCSTCHLTSNHVVEGKVYPPLFTDYTYDNLGIPTNPRVYVLAGGYPPDLGLGPIVKDKSQNGKFKVPTLRNVAKSPPYGHNGYFPTLLEIVQFCNTRDSGSWAPPEYAATVNTTELGDLGLSPTEESSLVVFMQALTDEAQ